MTNKPSSTNGRRLRRLGAALAGAALMLLFSACPVGPKYKRPTVNTPATYRGQLDPAQAASLADLPWWEAFKDDTLKSLIQECLQNNLNLRSAVARVEQSRQLSAQARAQYYPTLGYEGTVSGGKNQFLGNASPNGGKRNTSLLGLLNAAWELDVWGRIRRLNESALAEYLATDEARRGLVLTLVSETAQAYYELLELDQELEIAKRTTESFKESLNIFTQRFEGGVASKLETSSAEAALADVAATVPELERQIVIKENQISVLLGRSPGPIPRGALFRNQPLPPGSPTGLPSALLERRPDIRQAEQMMRAANAQIGVAQASFFPTIGLSAIFGQASEGIKNSFTSIKSNVWAGAAGITGPIFQGGALKSKKRQALAYWEETITSYQATILNAYQEVANALVSADKYEAARKEQEKAVTAYVEAVKLSQLRYLAGKAGYYEVLQALQNLFPSENALSRVRLNQFVNLVQLYKALGGGWNLKDAEWAGSPAPAK